MEYPFSFLPPLHLGLTFLLVLIHLVLLVMALLWTTDGLMVDGLLPNFHCPLHTRNCCFGSPCVLVGPECISCFTLIMKLWCIFLTHGHLQTQMHLLRSLFKAAACFSFTFVANHVPGRNNGIADVILLQFSGL